MLLMPGRIGTGLGRILHVAHLPHARGGEIAMARYVIALANRGHHVMAAFPLANRLSTELQNAGVEVCIYGTTRVGTPLTPIAALSTLIRSSGVDIIHSHDGLANLLCRACRARFPGIRLVSSVHRIRRGWARLRLPFESLPQRMKRTFRANAYSHIERWSRRYSDLLVAHSEAIAADLDSSGVHPSRLQILRHGLPDDWFIGSPRQGCLRRPMRQGTLIGVVGAVEPAKGQHLVLEALHACSVPNSIGIVFAGRTDDSHYRRRLEQMAKRLGLCDRVVFAGEVEDMRSLYADLDLVVQASYTEGLPLAVMEAMAVGRAVVATAVGGTPELIAHGQTGILVPCGDVGMLAAAIDSVLASTSQRSQLAQAAHAYALSAFRMERAVDRLEDIYRLLQETDPCLSSPTE